jgi:hypothetical protein
VRLLFLWPIYRQITTESKAEKIQSISFVGEFNLIIVNQFAVTKQEACDGIIDDLLVKVLQVTQRLNAS